jgi:hypothetical protein
MVVEHKNAICFVVNFLPFCPQKMPINMVEEFLKIPKILKIFMKKAMKSPIFLDKFLTNFELFSSFFFHKDNRF